MIAFFINFAVAFQITERISLGDNDMPDALTVDDVLSSEMLSQWFGNASQWDEKLAKSDWGYPGIMYYLAQPNELSDALNAMVSAVTNQTILKSKHWVSLITLKEHELNEKQSLPHIDSHASMFMFASILYLFNSTSFGGTLFFDDLPTPDEKTTAKKFQGRYANCEQYRCIGRVDSKCNRAAVYPAWQLHAAAINNASELSTSAQHGRLTVTSLYYMQRSELRDRESSCE